MLRTNDASGTNIAEVAEGVYFSHGPNVRPVLERLAALQPATLACMHGSAWRGAGSGPLLALADALAPKR